MMDMQSVQQAHRRTVVGAQQEVPAGSDRALLRRRRQGIDVRLTKDAPVLGRLTAWGANVSMACKIRGHARCSMAELSKTVRVDDILAQWLLDGLIAADGAARLATPKLAAIG